MTANEYRKLALGFPETEEGSHMGHPDYRVCGKIFATLGPDEDWGVVKLTPAQQSTYLANEPDVFVPATGAWGRRGYTTIHLRRARKTSVREALTTAWRNTAPRRLVREFDGESA